ncbi:MAG TPA: glycosyl hydrolase family 18 protein [Candidatus Dojkabacteria bacterium]|nr:glycosyl hydrolase family 18 protein [Candidatus Dojkabacteria bacterium]
MKKLVLITIPIIIVIASILALTVNSNKNKLESADNSTELGVFSSQNILISNDSSNIHDNTNEPEIEETHQLTTSAWIVYWDLNRGIETVVNNKAIFTSASPVWYAVNSDGSLALKSTARNNKLRDEFKQNSIKIIPTIADFNSENLSIILNSPSKRSQHIQYIINEVNTYDYDGIDIDYEDIKSNDKEVFSLFVKELSENLHSYNKLLTIVLEPKTDAPEYTNFATRQAQDWVEIAKYADEIRIMGYDYQHSYHTDSGPISSVQWLETILIYATETLQIPPEKIVLALPLYGYNWDSTGSSKTTAVTWEDIQKIKINNSSHTDVLDELSKENHLIYGTKHIWYQDSTSIIYRLELAQKYKIKGVIFWRLGGEDEKIWEMIK